MPRNTNDDAVVLLERMRMVLETYAPLDTEPLIAAISRDFEGQYGVDGDTVIFVFGDLEFFKFVLGKQRDPENYDLTVFGRDELEGFMIQAPTHTDWFCRIDDELAVVTVEAKRLVELLQRKFNIKELKRL